MRVGRADERDPGPDGVADAFGAQVEAERQAVDLQCDVVLECDLVDRSRSSAFSGRRLM